MKLSHGVAVVGTSLAALASWYVWKKVEEIRRKPTLFHSFPFRSCRCAWLVREIGPIESLVDVEPVRLHGKDASDMNEYKREVHPHATIPALRLANGTVLMESAAIILYLQETMDRANFFAPEHCLRGEYYNLITYAAATVDPVLDPLYMQLTHIPDSDRDNALVKRLLMKFHEIFMYLEQSVLAGETARYLCGERFTAADCMLGYNVWWASMINKGELLEDYPNIRAYLDRLSRRPAFKETFLKTRESGSSL